MGVISKIKNLLFIRLRILKYNFLSDNKIIGEKLKLTYPVLFSGKGKICIDKTVRFGYKQSPFFYNSYGYIEARTENAEVRIGKNVIINNNFSIIVVSKLEIQENTLIGPNFYLMDSNFHFIDPNKRHSQNVPSEEILIGKNVFIGNNVTVLKGVTIGENSVIGSNSLISKSVPSNVVVSGNPAQIIKSL